MTKVNTDSGGQGFVLGNKVLVAEVFAKNGFLVLSSGAGEEKTDEVNADQVSQGKELHDSVDAPRLPSSYIYCRASGRRNGTPSLFDACSPSVWA